MRCPVGDKYVMEEMLKSGVSLGGEQSGHVIFSDYLYTGDGLCTALNVLRTIARTGRTLAEPRLRSDQLPAGAAERAGAREGRSSVGAGRGRGDCGRRIARTADGGQGRLLIRYSGTEPLLRVMLEGRHESRDPRPGPRRSSTSSKTAAWD